MIKILILLALSTTALGRTVTVDPQRTITIKGEVDSAIVSKAAKLHELAEPGGGPIYLVINSPGGQVYPGLLFINAMKMAQARGIRIVCVVPMMAASMAFQILAECDERYALRYAFLLWHPMRAFFRDALSGEDLAAEGDDINRMEAYLILRLLKVLRISKEVFFYHYRRETMWTAERLNDTAPGFLTIVDDIKGVSEPFGGL